MFPDGTVDLFTAYDCFLCGWICNSGDDFFYHLADEHKASPMEGITSSYAIPEDKIFMAPTNILNAALLALVFGQVTIMNHILQENAKRFAMITNVKI